MSIARSKAFFLVLISLTYACLSVSSVARADLALSSQWFSAKTEDERAIFQAALILLGHYTGLVDAVFGRNTYQAIISYQRSQNLVADGVLSKQEELQLLDQSLAVYDDLGFKSQIDERAQIRLPIPMALFARSEPAKWGTRWKSGDGSIEMETLAIPESDTTFPVLFRRLSNASDRKVEYSVLKEDFFVLSGSAGARKFYTAFVKADGVNRGFSISWTPAREKVASIVSIFVASMVEFPVAGSFEDTDEAEEPRGDFSGSGFAISHEGAIVTNAHVVEDCQRIEVVGYGDARLLDFDADYDLAVLRLTGRKPTSAARIQLRPPELGQQVVILGYPLSDLMGGALSVTTGLISSLSGVGGDKALYTLTANIQPGNSGGPVLDMRGNVVGVAVAKLDEAKMLQAAGTTGANIGFAIKGAKLREFLGPFKTSTTASKKGDELSVQAIASLAKKFTVQILCRN